MFFFNRRKNKKTRANIIHQVLITEEAKWNYVISILEKWKGSGVVWLLCHFEENYKKLGMHQKSGL